MTEPRRYLQFGVTDGEHKWDDDEVICIYVDGAQVAGAVRQCETLANETGCEYQIVSRLDKALKPLLCRDKERAILWLEFLADLYEGKKK